jgi:hypothetical protein
MIFGMKSDKRNAGLKMASFVSVDQRRPYFFMGANDIKFRHVSYIRFLTHTERLGIISLSVTVTHFSVFFSTNSEFCHILYGTVSFSFLFFSFLFFSFLFSLHVPDRKVVIAT